MPRINRGLDTKGTGRRRHLSIAGLFSLLFLLATGAHAQDLSCIDCHNPNGIPSPHDPCCQETSCLQACHPKDLGLLQHTVVPDGPVTSDRTTTCRTCHNKPFPGVYHPYTINVSAGSLTPPGSVDLDQACGQCHGGGYNSTDNPPNSTAQYKTKAELSSRAQGIHRDKPTPRFSYVFGSSNSLIVNVDASGSVCINVCDAYDWDWGDGTPHDSGITASHAYAPGPYVITLKVTDTGLGTGAYSTRINVVEADHSPVVAGTCSYDANNWTATVIDSSTDDKGINLVTVNWGDGTLLSRGANNATLGPHTYINPGTFSITHTAYDTIGQSSSRICTANPSFFTIGGTVFKSNGTVPVPSATVVVKKGSTTVRTVYTASNGTFTVGSLKPGIYTLNVTKSGYTFANPVATITVGPSSPGNVIKATTP